MVPRSAFLLPLLLCSRPFLWAVLLPFAHLLRVTDTPCSMHAAHGKTLALPGLVVAVRMRVCPKPFSPFCSVVNSEIRVIRMHCICECPASIIISSDPAAEVDKCKVKIGYRHPFMNMPPASQCDTSYFLF